LAQTILKTRSTKTIENLFLLLLYKFLILFYSITTSLRSDDVIVTSFGNDAIT